MGSPPCRRSPSNDNTCPRSGRIAAPKSQKYVPTTIYTQIYFSCIHMYNKYVYVCICMYVYIYVKIFIHIYIHVHMQVYGYMYIYYAYFCTNTEREGCAWQSRKNVLCATLCVCVCERETACAGLRFHECELTASEFVSKLEIKKQSMCFRKGVSFTQQAHTRHIQKSSWRKLECIVAHMWTSHVTRFTNSPPPP